MCFIHYFSRHHMSNACYVSGPVPGSGDTAEHNGPHPHLGAGVLAQGHPMYKGQGPRGGWSVQLQLGFRAVSLKGYH